MNSLLAAALGEPPAGWVVSDGIPFKVLISDIHITTCLIFDDFGFEDSVF